MGEITEKLVRVSADRFGGGGGDRRKKWWEVGKKGYGNSFLQVRWGQRLQFHHRTNLWHPGGSGVCWILHEPVRLWAHTHTPADALSWKPEPTHTFIHVLQRADEAGEDGGSEIQGSGRKKLELSVGSWNTLRVSEWIFIPSMNFFFFPFLTQLNFHL